MVGAVAHRDAVDMALFVWVAVATAFWHFTIFVPDRFPGGMVGAFAWANAGALLAGVAVNGLGMPPLAEVGHVDAAIGAAGGICGLAASYVYGARRERGRGED
jgi:hypothetical protein